MKHISEYYKKWGVVGNQLNVNDFLQWQASQNFLDVWVEPSELTTILIINNLTSVKGGGPYFQIDKIKYYTIESKPIITTYPTTVQTYTYSINPTTQPVKQLDFKFLDSDEPKTLECKCQNLFNFGHEEGCSLYKKIN